MKPYYESGGITIYHADCREILPLLPAGSVDLVLTDPPYGLAFMGKDWDLGIPGKIFWQEPLRVAKPGCHLLAFGGTRTHHRLMCALEDAGWEIRDCLMWVYGSGFPKSLDVGKAIDKGAGARRRVVGHHSRDDLRKGKAGFRNLDGQNRDRGPIDLTAPATAAAKQWDGWGTALKPAWEPIILARKPLEGTVAENVQKWGTGALNIHACRIPATGQEAHRTAGSGMLGGNGIYGLAFAARNPRQVAREQAGLNPRYEPAGRWPANLIHDGSEEVLALFPETRALGSPARTGSKSAWPGAGYQGRVYPCDSGSAARFFYCAKASRSERDAGCENLLATSPGEITGGRREGSAGLDCPRAGAGRTSGGHNMHPTVKPLALMRYLCRLACPPGGLILDLLMGSGSTLIAAQDLGFRAIGIETEKQYCRIAANRLSARSAKSAAKVLEAK